MEGHTAKTHVHLSGGSGRGSLCVFYFISLSEAEAAQYRKRKMVVTDRSSFVLRTKVASGAARLES